METKLSFILILSAEDTNKLSMNAARKSTAPSLVLLIMSLESSAEIVRAAYTVYYNYFNAHYSDCSSSDVRLVGGPTHLEGILQVCYYNTWGLVSANGWTNKEASTVCKQLNYNVSSIFMKT